MTSKQKSKLTELEIELSMQPGTLPIRGENDGYVFTEVSGLTVLVGPEPDCELVVPSFRNESEGGPGKVIQLLKRRVN